MNVIDNEDHNIDDGHLKEAVIEEMICAISRLRLV